MIYIDELIILNFFIDYFILSTINFILKKNARKKRIVLSCIVGEISILYLFLNMNNIFLWLFKLLLGVSIILICFGYNGLKELLKDVLYFYVVSFFLGGILFYFKTEGLLKYQYFILLIPFILNIYKYFEYNIKNVIKYRYKVTIYLKSGDILYLTGHMDTGNFLIDPYHNKKVIVINKKVSEDFFLIPYKTIDNECLMRCFNPKKVYIDGIGERNDIVVGVVNKKFNGFNCLLNYKLLEG